MSAVAVAFLAAIALSNACVPTTPVTPTVPCCAPLTSVNVPKINPIGDATTYQQCSSLKRISSTCPTVGYLLCTAAPETNPTQVVIQVVDADGATIIKQSTGNPTANLQVYCVEGNWKANADGSGPTIAKVSCSQTGSTGSDYSYASIDEAHAGK